MRSAAAGAAVLSAGLLLSACGGSDDGPDVLPPITATPSVTSVAPTPSVSAFPDTPQGAAAFARLVYRELDRAFVERDPRILEPLVLPSCESCANYLDSLSRIRDEDLLVEGGTSEVLSAETPGGQSGLIDVSVRTRSNGIVLRDNAGRVVFEEKPALLQDRMTLQRRAGSYVVAEIVRL